MISFTGKNTSKLYNKGYYQHKRNVRDVPIEAIIRAIADSKSYNSADLKMNKSNCYNIVLLFKLIF